MMLARIRSIRLVVVGIAITSILLSGCQTTSAFLVSEKLGRLDANRRVLLMPIDVELAELNAGGVTEPNAEWTALGKKLIKRSLREFLRERYATLTVLEATENPKLESTEFQLIKLHAAVGNTILAHKYFEALKLPTKGEKFDWTLGPEVKILRDQYDANHALFIYLRDSYTSGGRAVAIVLAAVLFGVALQGGVQQGFASLVDLRTGDVVWFNRLLRGAGDLRTKGPARESVNSLLVNFPK